MKVGVLINCESQDLGFRAWNLRLGICDQNVIIYTVCSIILFLLSFNTSAQWSWINPLPQGNTLHDVQFISALTGFAVGDGGTILKTIDGGYTWNRMGNGSMVSLNSVFFLDTSIGWAISKEFEVLLKTTDGGITWTKAYNFDTFDMNDVWFTDPMHGVAVGYESVFITSDGGITWLWKGPYSWNYSIWFTDPGTAIMSSDWYLYKSVDGGNTWTIKQSNVYGWRGSLFFMDADIGLHVGGAGQIYKTIDGGETWDSIYSGTSNVLSASYIFPNGTGYAVGYSGTMLKTTDAGASWVTLPSLTDYDLETITFSDASHGIITGELGLILITENAGVTWTSTYSTVTKKNLNAVCFPDQNTGYAAGGGGTVLKSVNGGNSWQQLSIPVWDNFYSMFFNDPQTGYVAGAGGTMLKTTDGGGSWTSLSTGFTHNLICLDFPDDQIGYAIGLDPGFSDSTYLLKTTNAGLSWTVKTLGYGSNNAMEFTSVDTGCMAGYNGDIIKTTDGGNTWMPQGDFPGVYFYDICFPTKNKGFACGWSAIYQTTDAGLHWDILYSGSLGFSRIVFTDPQNGYALAKYGYNDSWGVLFKTEDGGTTWSDKQINLTGYSLNDLCFKDADTGFVVGQNGVILKTSNGGGIITAIQPELLPVASAIVISPNPCSNRFQIQLSGIENSVSLQIYSILGKEVFSSKYNSVQKLNVTLPLLPSASYVVRIRTDSEVIVKKLVIH
jgi:photosystem II stability/assembly factor-like uncharacterized protein